MQVTTARQLAGIVAAMFTLLAMGVATAQEADWPQELVDRALPRLLAGLANRADPRSLMAWTLARGSAPGLDESWV